MLYYFHIKTIFTNENKTNDIFNNFIEHEMTSFKNFIKNINNIYIFNYDYHIEVNNYEINKIRNELKKSLEKIKELIESIYTNYSNDIIKLEIINNIIKTLYNSNKYMYIEKKYNSIHSLIEKILTNINKYNNYNIINIIDTL